MKSFKRIVATLAISFALVGSSMTAMAETLSDIDADHVVAEGNLVGRVPSDSELLWQGKVFKDSSGRRVQYAGLKNGVIARMTFDAETGVFHVGASNGASFDVNVNDLQSTASEASVTYGERGFKRPNKCQVVTGVAGLAHTALWSAAAGTVGGPAGVAAGLVYGGFWWLVGSQC